MIDDFSMTKNVQRFIKGVEVVNTPIKGRVGNGLFYGPPGTGKTEAALWYNIENNVPYIRSRKVGSARTLLRLIVDALELDPEHSTDALFQQAVDALIDRPREIIVDEVEYLIKNGVVEVLRDLNDMTNTPVIMLGMEHANKKLRVFRHLYDRFSVVLRFDLFNREEISDLATEICRVKLSDCAVEFIEKEGQGKLRLTTTWFTRAEQIGLRNDVDIVTAEYLRGFEEEKI